MSDNLLYPVLELAGGTLELVLDNVLVCSQT